ncbi:putative serine/arginine-rich splicing factor 4-like 3 [Homarus americanus]|uniref:Putative serine/arginine-rich splicing factor 4-like 3 n=1 Tax=Homarus americanus TaxID=6706 RepID=A0A8J5N0E0_HOMAM|nr:putative serine/arginine-rich splicing factor 4-like 3 [Homarus americanus]
MLRSLSRSASKSPLRVSPGQESHESMRVNLTSCGSIPLPKVGSPSKTLGDIQSPKWSQNQSLSAKLLDINDTLIRSNESASVRSCGPQDLPRLPQNGRHTGGPSTNKSPVPHSSGVAAVSPAHSRYSRSSSRGRSSSRSSRSSRSRSSSRSHSPSLRSRSPSPRSRSPTSRLAPLVLGLGHIHIQGPIPHNQGQGHGHIPDPGHIPGQDQDGQGQDLGLGHMAIIVDQSQDPVQGRDLDPDHCPSHAGEDPHHSWTKEGSPVQGNDLFPITGQRPLPPHHPPSHLGGRAVAVAAELVADRGAVLVLPPTVGNQLERFTCLVKK